MRTFIGASTRNRVLVIIGVIALCLWIVYPVQDSLKLGLDLNGGVQLVLRVKTEDPQIPPDRRDEVVEQAMRTIDRRVNELGVSESVSQRFRPPTRSWSSWLACQTSNARSRSSSRPHSCA